MLKMSMLTQKDYLTQCILYIRENGIMLLLKHATKLKQNHVLSKNNNIPFCILCFII